MVSSERLSADEPWTPFGQDQLLVCDPEDPDNPAVEHLLGERAGQIEFVPLDHAEGLKGTERGEWAARRATVDF